MKKSFLFLVLATTLAGTNLQAQDTVHQAGPKSNYFSNGWLDSASYRRWERTNGYTIGDAVVKYFQTDDTLTVYGIAGILLTPWDDMGGDAAGIVSGYTDTSRANSISYFRIYQYDVTAADTMVALGERLPVVATDAVTYYLDMGAAVPDSFNMVYDTVFPPYPVYERYFQTAQTVQGTFYAGINFDMDWAACNYGNNGVLPTLPFYMPLFIPSDPKDWHGSYACHNFSRDPMTGAIDTMWLYVNNSQPYMYVFPILTPEPVVPSDTLVSGEYILHPGNTLVIAPGDTLVIGGDTLVNTGDSLVVALGDTLVLGGSTFVVNAGDTLFVTPGDTLFVSPDGTVTVNPGGTFVVGSGSGTSDPGDDPGVGLRQTDMLYRYTSVSPNPASGRATVTSSFGLERIEVYDSQGRQTLTLPATGYRATLDLSAWPRGTYLLRIHTPLGTTTKKLIVQ